MFDDEEMTKTLNIVFCLLLLTVFAAGVVVGWLLT